MAEDVLQTTLSPQTVMWAQYPDGRYGAVVQSDGRAIYFAVQKLEHDQAADQPSRWVWVRNLRAAPLMFAAPEGPSDRLPLVPEGYCREPRGGPPLDLDRAKILWFEQGIGAVLVEANQVVAMIPPQPNADVPGYSAQCQRACAVALPLEDDDVFSHDINGLAAYWDQWSQKNPAEDWGETLRPLFAHTFGARRQEFTNLAGSWPAMRIGHHVGPERQVLVTTGVAVRCQPMVERDLLNYREHQRFELAIELPATYPADQVPAAAQWLAGMARYPWFHETCFLPTHTVATRVPGAPQRECPPAEAGQPKVGPSGSTGQPSGAAAVIVSDLTRGPEMGRAPLQLPPLLGQPVNLWWLRPLPGL